jgi:subtilisin family serine protease
MKRVTTLIALAALYAAAFIVTGVSGQHSSEEKFRRADPAKRVADQYIVVLRSDTNPDFEATRLSRDYSGDTSFGYIYRSALKGFSVRMSEAQAIKLAADSSVAFVEEDSELSLAATQANAPWGLDRIDQRDRPLNGTYNYFATGTGVKAYIIDSGIRATHNEYSGRVISGFTAINDGRGTDDCLGHGSHVAGIVGGSTYGVAKNVSLVAVRVFDCAGSGTTSAIVAGIDWVTSDHQPGQSAVANLSLSGGATPALDTAVDNSINDGVTYSVAAGNANTDACGQSPGRVANAITVGSTDTDDSRAPTSNFGPCVDVFAPGVNITSAWNSSDSATSVVSGTSMATAHTTGVAALFLEMNPGASPASVGAAIRNSATTNHVTNAGTGSPNLLLYSLLAGAAPTPTPTSGYTLTASPNTINPGQPITVTWTAPNVDHTNDWIALYTVGNPDTSWISWQYTGGLSSGSVTFTAPTQAGQYEFRYFTHNSYTKVATSNPVTVTQ